MTGLGDRMKQYENVERRYLTRRMPVIVRVDGRAFHTVTKGCKKPFDHDVINAMFQAALDVFSEMQGCKMGYVQSDEASFLLTDFDRLETESWFGNNLQKIVSISASVMTAEFNLCHWSESLPVAYFDSRAFNIPKEEVANYFLWRAKDWARNSLQMFCRAHFSHKELKGKNTQAMHDMLHSIGKNWTTDCSDVEKNGTWILPDKPRYDIKPSYAEIAAIVNPLMEPRE